MDDGESADTLRAARTFGSVESGSITEPTGTLELGAYLVNGYGKSGVFCGRAPTQPPN
jgi:hypothetical protein